MGNLRFAFANAGLAVGAAKPATGRGEPITRTNGSKPSGGAPGADAGVWSMGTHNGSTFGQLNLAQTRVSNL